MTKIRFLYDNLEEIISGSTFIVMVVITIVNVFTRYFGNFVISTSEELARYCFIWMTFFGAALCTKKGQHIVIDFLILNSSKSIQFILNCLVDIIVIIFIAILGYYSWELAFRTTTATSTLGIPLSYILYPIPFACALIFIRSFEALVKQLRTAFIPGGKV
jgi:TRAP-type C4-dicarboxylate transport system permease small subunit